MATAKKPTKAKKKVTTVTTVTTTTTEEVLESTHITLVIDRSASMRGIAEALEAQVNAFVQEQHMLGGECSVSVILFDDRIDIVHNNIDISRVPHLRIQPRGNTALNDATMQGIALASRSKAVKQIVVIVTDGEENCSKQYRSASFVKEEILKHDTWAFMFFGTERAFEQARDYGVSSMNAMSYATNDVGVKSAGGVMRSATSNFRKGLASNQALFADPKANK